MMGDTVAFWIYTYIMETVLPIGFYSLMLEPLTISRVFNKILEIIDPESFTIMKEVVTIFFPRELLALF